MFVTEDVAEVLKQQVVIAHIIVEVFIIGEYMFDAIRGGFSSGTMGLTKTGKSDAVPIGDLAVSMLLPNKGLDFNLLMDSSKVLFGQRS